MQRCTSMEGEGGTRVFWLVPPKSARLAEDARSGFPVAPRARY
jgi:hypothetical protein